MKLILDRPVTDRVDGKIVTHAAGSAVDFPEDIAQDLLAKEAGHEYPKTREEKELLESAVKHPVPKPEVPVKK